MVSPERKRTAVLHLQESFAASARRAGARIRQPRSTQRHRGRRRDEDAVLAAELRRLSRERPRAGYRMAAALLRRAGMKVNARRVQRRWRQAGLKVPRKQRQRQRLGPSANGTQGRRAPRVHEVWSHDFVCDQTEDGRRRKWLPIGDEFRRESVALAVERRRERGDVIRILDAAVSGRGAAPEFIRRDNGPAFIALAVPEWIERRGFQTRAIAPGSPARPSTSLPIPLRRLGGRTPPAKASRGAFALSSSTGKALPRCWRRKSSASNTGKTTTTTAGLPDAGGIRAAQPCGGLPTHHITTNPPPENHTKLSW